jgi:hypothetical protein
LATDVLAAAKRREVNGAREIDGERNGAGVGGDYLPTVGQAKAEEDFWWRGLGR